MGRLTDPLERFNEKFEPEPNTGCWLWTGYSIDGRYGDFWLNGENVKAHRVAYSMFVGEIPAGMYVLHRCDQPFCVNPKHLRLGSLRDNTQDMMSKGRNRPPRGERNGQAKLRASDVVDIRRRLSDGEKPREIARHFGVGEVAISLIKNRKRWASVA